MEDNSLAQKLGAEALGTAVLVFLGAGSVPALFLARGGTGGAPFTGAELLAGLVIGFIVIGVIITVAPQTGAAINPARYTGTLITAQLAGLNPDWGQAWVYWVADVVGGLAGVFAYDVLATPRRVSVH